MQEAEDSGTQLHIDQGSFWRYTDTTPLQLLMGYLMEPSPEHLLPNEPENRPQFSADLKTWLNKKLEDQLAAEKAGTLESRPAEDFLTEFRKKYRAIA